MHAPIRRDPAMLLIRALLDLGRGHASLVEHQGRSWASATFAGMRHRLVLEFDGAAAVLRGEHLAKSLAEREFALPGHIVADITIAERHARSEGTPRLSLTIEALTVEDG